MTGDVAWRKKNEIIGSAFIDLSKAFDYVCHTTLLEKLPLYGFCGNSLQRFKSYLLGRRQRVVFGGVESDLTDVCKGVPQGSILGPLLLSIFINDSPAGLSRSTMMMYVCQ